MQMGKNKQKAVIAVLLSGKIDINVKAINIGK